MIPASRRRLAVLHLVVASPLIGLGARLWFVQHINQAGQIVGSAVPAGKHG